MDEDTSENEEEESVAEPAGSNRLGSIVRYKIPIIIVIAFIAGVLVTNSINSSISGAIISGLESEKQNIQSTGSVERTNL